MKRRDFMKKGAMTIGAPLAVGAAGRLYGTPASIRPVDLSELDKFKLPFSNFGVPVELWDSFSRVGKLWDDVLTDESKAKIFNSNPKAYFDAIGLDSSDKTFRDESVILLRTIAAPQAKEAIASGDYAALYSILSAAGVFELNEPSTLQQTVEKIFSDNYEEIKKSISSFHYTMDDAHQKSMLLSLNEAGVQATSDDLVILKHLFGSNNGQLSPMCASCVAAVVVAVFAALYVSVAIAVTVGLLAGAWISVAVQAAVVAAGP